MSTPSTKTPISTEAQAAALENFLNYWSAGDLLFDIGPKLNCCECDALVVLLRAHGYDEAAEILLNGHCEGDEEGDDAAHLDRKNANAQSA